jgi:menaquinone-dependent protoporphyrinogen oxidase
VPRVLIVYATFDGQTARIAERVGQSLRRDGHAVTLRGIEAIEVLWEIDTHDAVIVGGSIRYGRHSPLLENMVRDRLEDLAQRPGAFYSVCLSAGGPGARPDVAKGYREEFLRRTGWRPALDASFAGALLYRRYNPFVRFMMRLIVGAAGGETDASRDYEYTDWNAVDRFAADFAARLLPAHAHRDEDRRVLERL